MRRNARFWRNVILIALVHLGALVALLRWAGSSKIAAAQEITWLNTGGEPTETADVAKAEETPTPDRNASHPLRKKINQLRRRQKARSKSLLLLLIQRRHQAWSRNHRQNLHPNPAPGKRPRQNRALPPRKRNHALKRRQRRKKKQRKNQRIRKTKPPLPDPKRNRTKKLRRLEKGTLTEKPELLPIRPTQLGTATCCTIAFIANGSSQPPWSPAEQSFRHWQKSESKKMAAFPISRLCGRLGTSWSMSRSKPLEKK